MMAWKRPSFECSGEIKINTERFARGFDGYVFDLDGTVYLGDQLIPGADEAIAELRRRGARMVFVTNKPLENRRAYAAKLTRLGIPATEDDVINSSLVMADYLKREAPGARVYCIGEPPLLRELHEAGMVLVADPRVPGCEVDYVVAAFDRSFDYEKLDCALQAIRRGARFIATNGDRTCPVEGGVIPDCGGIIAAIEAVTGKTVELVVGKPHPLTAETALRRLGLPAHRCLLVGDRLETDILMGKRVGMKTALVLTGVTRREDVPAAAADEGPSECPLPLPDFILESVRDVPTLCLRG